MTQLSGHLVWFGILASAVVMGGCGVTKSHAGSKDEGKKATNALEVKPAASLLKQLQIGGISEEEVAGSLRVAGRVEANERRLARVGSPVTGRITELLVFEGQHVRKGDVLAKLHSTQLSDTQFSFLRAYSQQELARRAAGRAKLLLDANVIGTAELQRRNAELDQATAELSSVRTQLQVLGMTEEAIDILQATRALDSEFLVRATIDGTLLERKVTMGQIVQPAETAFVIADLSQVWLVAEVPEQSAGHLMPGKAAQAEIPALPGTVINGRLTFVSSIVNPATGTVTARMDVDNPKGLFKPAMLATVILKDSPQLEQVIPATAVVRENNQEYVFVQKETGVFSLRRVTLGEEYNDTRVVKEGIGPVDKVVLDGAFHLNNERKRMLLEGGA